MKPGDQVRITSGPFAQFVGEVEKSAPKRRVFALMELMVSKTRVAVKTNKLRIVCAHRLSGEAI